MLEERLTDDLVGRMHAVLATALRRGRPDPFGSPVTVAEIYQDLVPYRTVRTQLGFDMNADYEHTLLRLLAGEAGLARLDPPEAREELKAELDTPNPNVGLFRKFAACDVWITPGGSDPGAREQELADPATPAVEAADGWSLDVPVTEFLAGLESEEEDPAAGDAWDPREGVWEREQPQVEETYAPPSEAESAEMPETPPAAGWTEELAETELLLEDAVELPEDELTAVFQEEGPAVPPASTTEITDGGEMSVAAVEAGPGPDAPIREGGSCAFCDSTLPGKRVVRFCPYCGADQSTLPCAACAEPVEPGWNYCVACGSTAPAAANA